MFFSLKERHLTVPFGKANLQEIQLLTFFFVDADFLQTLLQEL